MGDKNWVLMSNYDDEHVWDLECYLKSLSPRISVSISEERSGVYIAAGHTVHSGNTIEHLRFVRIPSDYFYIDSSVWCDAEVYYVPDVPAFVNTLTEEEKSAFLPSMPFLRAYHWCGPSQYLPFDDGEHLQRIVQSILHALDEEGVGSELEAGGEGQGLSRGGRREVRGQEVEGLRVVRVENA